VANCVAERTFSQEEVKALQSTEPWFGHRTPKDFNNGEWHAIMMEKVNGRSFMSSELALGNSETEKKAVRNMLETASQMLKAGVVNVDQWHNILFDSKNGDANFIDMEGCHFLTRDPLQVANDAGEVFEAREHLFEPGGYRVKTSWSSQKELSPEAGQQQATKMMSHIFGLIPKHAFDEADMIMDSRVRSGSAELDALIDKEWQQHKDFRRSSL